MSTLLEAHVFGSAVLLILTMMRMPSTSVMNVLTATYVSFLWPVLFPVAIAIEVIQQRQAGGSV